MAANSPDELQFLMAVVICTFMSLALLNLYYSGPSCFNLHWTCFVCTLNLLVYLYHLHQHKKDGEHENQKQQEYQKQKKNYVARSIATANLSLFAYFTLFRMVGLLIKYARGVPLLWNGVFEELADIFALVNCPACPLCEVCNKYHPFADHFRLSYYVDGYPPHN